MANDLALPIGVGQDDMDQAEPGNRGPGGPAAGLWVPKNWDDAQPTYRTAGQMVAYKHQLTINYAQRDMLLRFLQKIYDGEFWRVVAEEIRTGGFRHQRYKTDQVYRLTANYVFATTNNFVDLLSKLPSIHVPALHDSDDHSRRLAAQNEKVHYGIWEASQFPDQFYDLAWFLSLLGTAVIESTPDPTDFIPKLLVQHPAFFYPQTRFGRPGEILYGIKRFFITREQAIDAYGKSWMDNKRYVTIDTSTGQWVETTDWTNNMARIEGWYFYSPWERALFLQDRIVNDFSVQFDEPQEVPWRVVFFTKRPGKLWGIGSAEQIWGLNQYFNQLLSMQANILAYAANPQLVVVNGQQAPEDIANDPGSVIGVNEGGKAEWLQWHGNIPEMVQQLARVKTVIEDVSGMPETRYGTTKQSFVTGRAVEQLNAPTADRIASHYRLMATEIQHINRIAIGQFERIAKNRKVRLYGDHPDTGAFAMEVKGSDIEGYDRNFVTWDEHDHGDAVELLQLAGAGALDKETMLTKLGFKEPLQILKRVRQETLENIAITQLMEQAKAAGISPAEGQKLVGGDLARSITSPMAPDIQQAGLQAGGVPGGPGGMPALGATPPGGPPPAPGGALAGPGGPAPGVSPLIGGGPPPAPTRAGFGPSAGMHLATQGMSSARGIFHLGQVVSDFKAIPPLKIRGRVYVYGHITEGAASKIQVLITAGLDKKTIIDNLPPEYNGHLLFRIGSTAPPGAVDVTPDKSNVPPSVPGNLAAGPGGPEAPNPGGEFNYEAGPRKRNPPGALGPVLKEGLVTPQYQNLPMQPPGTGMAG